MTAPTRPEDHLHGTRDLILIFLPVSQIPLHRKDVWATGQGTHAVAASRTLGGAAAAPSVPGTKGFPLFCRKRFPVS